MAMTVVHKPSDTRTLLWMTGILIVAAGLAILPVQGKEAGGSLLRIPGYTASLALAFVPLVPLWIWLKRGGAALTVEHEAFRLTARLVLPFWTVLDVVLAHRFFLFPNPEGTSGLNVPGLHPVDGWGLNIPIEELFFYLFACLTNVLLYAWSSERWFRAYSRSPDDYRRRGALCVRRIQLEGRMLLLVAAFFASLYAFKKLGDHTYHEGFPWYALVLIAGLLLPNYTIYQAISGFINKQAMLFTMTVVVLFSLIWEATLGLPNGWWAYQDEAMVGIFVSPWGRLPIEAAFLWLMAGWGNVVLYEFFRLKLYSSRGARELVFRRAAEGAQTQGKEQR